MGLKQAFLSVSKASLASTMSVTHSLFLLAPSLDRCLCNGCVICNPRAERILLQNHLYPGCHQPGHSRHWHPKKTSLNKFWGHHIDGRATIHKSPTSLTIKPDLGYVLRSTPLSMWIKIQEGNFLRHLQTMGASSEDASWVTTDFWGVWPPFFVIPSSVFKLTFQEVLLRSFRQSFTRFFPLIQLNYIGKMDNIPNWLICSSNSTQGSCILSHWRLSLFFLFNLHASKGMTALQLLGGKQIPW